MLSSVSLCPGTELRSRFLISKAYIRGNLISHYTQSNLKSSTSARLPPISVNGVPTSCMSNPKHQSLSHLKSYLFTFLSTCSLSHLDPPTLFNVTDNHSLINSSNDLSTQRGEYITFKKYHISLLKYLTFLLLYALSFIIIIIIFKSTYLFW